MADVRGLMQDAEGNRYAWNGYDWVPVSRDFDPRTSALGAGFESATGSIGAGINQLRAWIRGDEAALADLAAEERERQTGAAIVGRQNPMAYLAGQIAPYAAGAAAGGLAGGAATGGSVLGATVGATAADVALGGLSYGTPEERALNAGIAAAGPVAVGGAVALGRRAARPFFQPGARAERVQQNIEAGAQAEGDIGLTPGAGAGGSVFPPDPGQVSRAAQIAGRMLQVGRSDVDADRLLQTRRARALAAEKDIALTPAMRTGSRGMAQIEAALMSNPYSAAPGLKIRNQFMRELEDRAKEFLLPSSEAPSWLQYDGALDADFIRAIEDNISRKYEDISSKSPAISSEDIVKSARELAAPERGAAWTAREEKIFGDLLERVRNEGEELQGQAAWNMAQLQAKEAARRFDAGKYQEGIAYQSVADAIEQEIIEAAGGKIDQEALNLLRKQYRVMKTLRSARALDKGGLYLGRGYNAMLREFPRQLGEARRFQEPNLKPLNDLLDVFEVGGTLFQDVVGDSGTATRLAVSDLSPQGMGQNIVRRLAAALYYGEPAVLRPTAGEAAGAAALGLGGAALAD